MGVICKNDPKKINSSIEADTEQNIYIEENDYSKESLKNQRNDLKKKQEELLEKINKKFNAINNSNSNNNFQYKKIIFHFQEEDPLEISIDRKTPMNKIYEKIKEKKISLPNRDEIYFNYKTNDISSLFKCHIPISKIHIDLNNPIMILYNNNNVKMPPLDNI